MVGRWFRLGLLIFLILSLLVLWGVGELFTSPEGRSAVSPAFQTVAFALVSLMMVGLLTVYLKSKKSGGVKEDDDTEH